jgi:hypothetical protein
MGAYVRLTDADIADCESARNEKNSRMPILSWLTRDDDNRAASLVPYRLLEEVPASMWPRLNAHYGLKETRAIWSGE